MSSVQCSGFNSIKLFCERILGVSQNIFYFVLSVVKKKHKITILIQFFSIIKGLKNKTKFLQTLLVIGKEQNNYHLGAGIKDIFFQTCNNSFID